MADRAPARAGAGASTRGGAARAASSRGPLDTLFPGRAGAAAGWVLAIIVAADLFAMMLLTFIDVSGRKLFTRPIYGAYEVTEFMMGTLIFCALPLVTAREGHVTIDVMDSFMPRRFARMQQIVVTAISTVVLAFLSWRLWELSASHFRTNEVTMTLHIPHGPFSRFFAVMAGLAAIASAVIFWGYLRGRRDVVSGGGDTAS